MLMHNWLVTVRGAFGNWARGAAKPTQHAHRGQGRISNISAIVESLECRQLLSGATITVDISGDTHKAGHTTLRDAINQANKDGGDTIRFAGSLAGSTITLTHGELAITSTMTITGLGATQLTIDGNGASRIFDIKASLNSNVTITGLTLQHGNGLRVDVGNGGGAIYAAARLTLANITITADSANGPGGGIAVFGSGKVTSTNDTFSKDSANGPGGAIAVSGGGSFTSTNDTISGSFANGPGGAISVSSGSTFKSTNDAISGNSANSRGGGIAIDGGTFNSSGDTISGNSVNGLV
jgi:hypothetical protein